MPSKRNPAAATEAAPLVSGGSHRYKYGEGGETDDFISGITGAKVRGPSGAPARYEPSIGTESVASNYYSPDRDAENATIVCGVKHCRSRTLFIVVGLILVGGGAALLAFLNMRGLYLEDLWPMAYFSMNVLGAIYIIAGIVGVASAIADRDMWRRAALFLNAVGCCGIALAFVMATMVRSGSQDPKLLSDWESMIVSDPSRACTVEHDMNCTGWTVACAGSVTPPTPTPIPSPSSPPASVDVPFADTDVEQHRIAAAATVGRPLRQYDVVSFYESHRRDSSTSVHQRLASEAFFPEDTEVFSLGNSTGANQCPQGCNLSQYQNVTQPCAVALQALVRRDYPAAIGLLVFGIVWTLAMGALVYVKRDKPTGYGSLQA